MFIFSALVNILVSIVVLSVVINGAGCYAISAKI